MTKYYVLFERETSEQIQLEVEADNIAEAQTIAEDKLGNGLEFDWENTDFLGDPYIVTTSDFNIYD